MTWNGEERRRVHNERIAILEDNIAKIVEDQEKIMESLRDLRNEIARYKGFMGGIAFVVSGVSVIWGVVGDYFVKR